VGPVTVKLRTPIEFGSQRIEELAFRPLTGKDLRKLPEGSSMDVTLVLAGRLSGQPDPVIDKLTGDDLWEVMTVVSGFMPGGPPTGSAPSAS
jgi:Phage tail assembly chaperone proteins, E, or 41 or 14